MKTLTLEVNQQPISADLEPRMHLADFIREEGRLTGTHLGCEHGVCGACTVLVGGKPVRSCITFAVACQDKTVTTIEGYGDDPVMALLRTAFSRHHALQCGYCTPGMLATSRDIVLRFADADEAKIRLELSGNLCRCTGYMGIVNAIQDVLAQCREGKQPAVEQLRAASLVTSGSGVSVRPFFQVFQAVNTETEATVITPAAPEESSGTSIKAGTNIQGSFTVVYPVDQVWAFMIDLPAVAGCLPGAELTEHVADKVKGRVAIKFGPMSASFVGAAHLEVNPAERSATLKGAGLDSISKSRANGDVTYSLVATNAQTTQVNVNLLYSLQGPLAQFSRSGLVNDFVQRLIVEFGKNVSSRMDPNRLSDATLPAAQLNAFSLALSVIWSRIRRMFGGQGL